MGSKSQAEIVDFFADLHAKNRRKDTQKFCDFLDLLFRERDFDGCTFFTSMYTFCIVRFSDPAEWRDAPLLAIRIASSANVLFEFKITTATKPVRRAVTESSSAPYAVALEEFDRIYRMFLAAYEAL